MDQTVNANLAKCIQQVDHFGYTTYHNICAGTHVDLAWGFGGWAAFAAVSVVIVLMLCAVGLLGRMIFSDI